MLYLCCTKIDATNMKRGRNTNSVSLYERKLKSGRIQLLLQIYAAGIRSQESTGILIEPNDSRSEQRQKRMMAEDIRRKRENDLRNLMLGMADPNIHLDDSFYDLYDRFTASRDTASTRMSYEGAKKHLLRYEPNEDITFRFITREWVRGFRDYLLTARTITNKRENPTRRSATDRTHRLSQNTASKIFQNLVAVLNYASSENIIAKSPADNVPGIPITESTREYLTEDELNAMFETECDSEDVKNAFLFACFTGLRFSDVRKLDWSDIIIDGKRLRISIRMKKTSMPLYVDVSKQAEQFLGERTEGLVFPGLSDNKHANYNVRNWAERAGIRKHVTFHVSRHTFATLLLKHNANLYTVSKLLGHTKITTTQIYAKIIDAEKRAAVDTLNDILVK